MDIVKYLKSIDRTWIYINLDSQKEYTVLKELAFSQGFGLYVKDKRKDFNTKCVTLYKDKIFHRLSYKRVDCIDISFKEFMKLNKVIWI